MEAHSIPTHTFLQSEDQRIMHQSRRRYRHSPPSLVLGVASSAFDSSSLLQPRTASPASLSGCTVLATPSPRQGGKFQLEAMQPPRKPFAMKTEWHFNGSQSSNDTSIHPASRNSSEFVAEAVEFTSSTAAVRSDSVQLLPEKHDMLLEAYRMNPTPGVETLEELAMDLDLSFEEVYSWFEDRHVTASQTFYSAEVPSAPVEDRRRESKRFSYDSPGPAPKIVRSTSSQHGLTAKTVKRLSGQSIAQHNQEQYQLQRLESRPVTAHCERPVLAREQSPVMTTRMFGNEAGVGHRLDGYTAGAAEPVARPGLKASKSYGHCQNFPLDSIDYDGFQTNIAPEVRTFGLQGRQSPPARTDYFARPARAHRDSFEEPVPPPLVSDKHKFSFPRMYHSPVQAFYPVQVHPHGDAMVYVPTPGGSVCSTTPFPYSGHHGGSYMPVSSVGPYAHMAGSSQYLQPMPYHPHNAWTYQPYEAPRPVECMCRNKPLPKLPRPIQTMPLCDRPRSRDAPRRSPLCQINSFSPPSSRHHHSDSDDFCGDHRRGKKSLGRWIKRVVSRISAPFKPHRHRC